MFSVKHMRGLVPIFDRVTQRVSGTSGPNSREELTLQSALLGFVREVERRGTDSRGQCQRMGK